MPFNSFKSQLVNLLNKLHNDLLKRFLRFLYCHFYSEPQPYVTAISWVVSKHPIIIMPKAWQLALLCLSPFIFGIWHVSWKDHRLGFSSQFIGITKNIVRIWTAVSKGHELQKHNHRIISRWVIVLVAWGGNNISHISQLVNRKGLVF